MAECGKCDGTGQLCNACEMPLSNVSQDCPKCHGGFCSIARQAAEDCVTGEKVDLGVRDCFTGHECRS